MAKVPRCLELASHYITPNDAIGVTQNVQIYLNELNEKKNQGHEKKANQYTRQLCFSVLLFDQRNVSTRQREERKQRR